MPNIHIARNQQQLGSFIEDEVREGIRSGRFAAEDLVWREGMKGWKPLGEMAPQWGLEPQKAAEVEEIEDKGDLPGPAWEQRKQIGFFPAIFQTIMGVLFRSTETFANLKQTGGFGEPFLYSIIIALIAQLAGIPLNLIDYNSNPQLSAAHAHLPGMSFDLAVIFGSIIVAALFYSISLFLVAGIIHLTLMSLEGSKTPFETTFRINSYASGSIAAVNGIILLVLSALSLIDPSIVLSITIFMLLPFLGTFAWLLACLAIGLKQVNQIAAWKAALAVILPWVFCFCLIFSLSMVDSSLIARPFASHLHP